MEEEAVQLLLGKSDDVFSLNKEHKNLLIMYYIAFNVSPVSPAEIWEALKQVLPVYLPIILSLYIRTLPSILQCILYQEY